jgi:hypothetical protein
MVAFKKTPEDSEEKELIKQAIDSYATIAMQSCITSAEKSKCGCVICRTGAEILANEGVMSCAAMMALRGEPEMLREISEFITELTSKYPNPLEEKP